MSSFVPLDPLYQPFHPSRIDEIRTSRQREIFDVVRLPATPRRASSSSPKRSKRLKYDPSVLEGLDPITRAALERVMSKK